MESLCKLEEETQGSTSDLSNPSRGMDVSKRRLSPSRGKAKYIAEIDELRINPIVSKRGYLAFLEEKSVGWIKRFVVSLINVLLFQLSIWKTCYIF